MKIPEGTTPALYGAAAGAIVLAVVGFTWGGWVTGGTAREMANKASMMAVASTLTPYCVDRSQNDPQATAVLDELKKASGFNRRSIIEKAGWATPLGAETPNRELAQACQEALAAL
jgi:alpha/beta superfamily hydrolase